jgi:exosortase/archaeosortase family protein
MPAPSTQSTTKSRQDLFLAAGLFVLTAAIFWPAVRWLTSQTFAHEQLKQSLFIVVLAGGWIAWEKRATLTFGFQFSNGALGWLFASYMLAAGAVLLQHPLFILAGLIAAVGGIVNFIFGGRAFRRTLPLLGVFALLILIVLLFPILDWPLRQMAGIEAARFLKTIGLAPQLAVSTGPEVKLALISKGQAFIVAPECNGFGLIASSLLLGTILLLYRRAAWWRLPLLLPLCIVVAFLFNLLRISTIVLLAPYFPSHYTALHETAGLIALYSGLGLVWLLTGRQRKPAPATANSNRR